MCRAQGFIKLGIKGGSAVKIFVIDNAAGNAQFLANLNAACFWAIGDGQNKFGVHLWGGDMVGQRLHIAAAT
jgi:hypothetical protein